MRKLAVALMVGSIAAACAEEAPWDGPTSGPRESEDTHDSGVETISSVQDAASAMGDAGSPEAGSDARAPLELSEPPEVPAGWVRVMGEYGISLAAPAPGLSAKAPKCGADSCSVPFEGECSYLADRNSFVDRLEHYEAPDYVVKHVRFDGMVARLVEGVRPETDDGKYMVAICLYVPNSVRPERDRGVAGVYARCPSAESAATARVVLQTLALAPRP